MSSGLFVTGTDTGIGKTHVALALMRDMKQPGVRVVGYKPVAAGASCEHGRWVNEDALALQACSDGMPAYERINPVCLPLPVSPHLAARAFGVSISSEQLVQAGRDLLSGWDLVIAEGAGGWRVPLGPGADIASLALDLGWPVVLVVGLRLGCINHARLTVEAMRSDGVCIAGWIANGIDPALMDRAGVYETLLAGLDIPLLADMMPEAVDLHWTEAGARWRKEILQIVFDSQK